MDQVRLVRAEQLEVTVRSDDTVEIRTSEGVLECTRHGLVILDAFSRPRLVPEAVSLLESRCASDEDWMNLTSTILQMRDADILRPEAATSARPTRRGFASPAVHVAMLNDVARTAGFIGALNEQVREDDVVLDIGTGTGILAVAAAKAGARHVYAVEAATVGHWASDVFEANGVADRVTLVPGWSTAVTLPEPATLLVTETIGDEPLGEGILEWVIDARRRLMVGEPRIIPRRLRILGVALSIPHEVVRQGRFTPDAVERWASEYGLDLGPLVDVGDGTGYVFKTGPGIVRRWAPLSEPVLLGELDLAGVERPMFSGTATAPATAAGELNAVALSFELELSPGRRLARPWNDPDDRISWRTPVWVLPRPLDVAEGTGLRFRYSYRVPGVAPHETVGVDLDPGPR